MMEILKVRQRRCDKEILRKSQVFSGLINLKTLGFKSFVECTSALGTLRLSVLRKCKGISHPISSNESFSIDAIAVKAILKPL